MKTKDSKIILIVITLIQIHSLQQPLQQSLQQSLQQPLQHVEKVTQSIAISCNLTQTHVIAYNRSLAIY
ncbi:MAG TPA: hypothetical protein VF581_07775 [Flavobacterium sp.]